jgi:hypothetical protein
MKWELAGRGERRFSAIGIARVVGAGDGLDDEVVNNGSWK